MAALLRVSDLQTHYFSFGGARVVKSVTGYDVPKLMVGSLGTLGVIVQVALKVRPLPKATISKTKPDVVTPPTPAAPAGRGTA